MLSLFTNTVMPECNCLNMLPSLLIVVSCCVVEEAEASPQDDDDERNDVGRG